MASMWIELQGDNRGQRTATQHDSAAVVSSSHLPCGLQQLLIHAYVALRALRMCSDMRALTDGSSVTVEAGHPLHGRLVVAAAQRESLRIGARGITLQFRGWMLCAWQEGEDVSDPSSCASYSILQQSSTCIVPSGGIIAAAAVQHYPFRFHLPADAPRSQHLTEFSPSCVDLKTVYTLEAACHVTGMLSSDLKLKVEVRVPTDGCVSSAPPLSSRSMQPLEPAPTVLRVPNPCGWRCECLSGSLLTASVRLPRTAVSSADVLPLEVRVRNDTARVIDSISLQLASEYRVRDFPATTRLSQLPLQHRIDLAAGEQQTYQLSMPCAGVEVPTPARVQGNKAWQRSSVLVVSIVAHGYSQPLEIVVPLSVHAAAAARSSSVASAAAASASSAHLLAPVSLSYANASSPWPNVSVAAPRAECMGHHHQHQHQHQHHPHHPHPSAPAASAPPHATVQSVGPSASATIAVMPRVQVDEPGSSETGGCCQSCGLELQPGERFCARCGCQLH